MSKRLNLDLIILGLLLLLIFLPFAPLFFANQFFPDSGMVYNDMTSFYYALKVWYQNQLRSGNLPFWTNLVGNGYPVFAEAQTAVFYPLNLLLYYFLPTVLAFNLNLFLHFFLAASATYFFSRISLGLGRTASLLAGLIYALSGFFFARISYLHMVFVVSYFPLNLLLVERIVSQRKIKYALFLALIFLLQILAGHNEMFFYSLILSAVFFLLLLMTRKISLIKPLFLFGLAVFLGLLMAAFQLLPNWELISQSHRAEGLSFESATASKWPLSSLVLFLNPRAFESYQASDYHPLDPDPSSFSVPTVYGYIGILSLVFAFFALTFFFKDRYVFVLSILLFLAFFWAQGRLSQIFTILWSVIPGLKFFRAPVKLLFAVEFFLAVLAGIGLLRGKEKIGHLWSRSLRFIILIDTLILSFVYFDLFLNNRGWQKTVSSKMWFADLPSAMFLKENLDSRYYQIYSHGTNNLDYQTTKDFQLQRDFQNILPANLNLIYGLPANRESFALFLKRQQELNSENTILDLEKEVLRLPPNLKKSLALQGVKYLLSDVPFEDPDLELVAEFPFSREVDHFAFLKNGQIAKIKVGKTHVYENKNVYPRILFVSQARDLSGREEKEVLETVLGPDFDPTKEVIIEEINSKSEARNPKQIANSPSTSLRVNNYRLQIKTQKETETEFQMETDQPGFLVLTRTFYPGWKAYLDGQETKVYRANYAFQAVAVPAGEHLVRFVFEPTHWRIGLVISGLGALGTLGALGYSLRKNK